MVRALLGVAVWLGTWQWDAWQARRDAEARDLTRAEPVPLADVIGPDDPFPGDRVGQPVILSGEWIDDAHGLRRARRAATGWSPRWRSTAPDDAALARRTRRRRRAVRRPGLRARPSWSAGCSRPRAPARPTPTRPTTCCRSCGWPTWCSGSTSTSTARYAVRDEPTPGLAGRRALEAARPSCRAGSPAARNLFYAIEWWVFGGVRAVRLGALPARRTLPGTRLGRPDSVGRVKSALTRYRVMATVVGVLLVVLVLIGVPLANFDGTAMWAVIPTTPSARVEA